MCELKLTFETESDLADFCRRLDHASMYTVACNEYDQELRRLVKYSEDADTSAQAMFFRDLFRRYCTDNGIDLDR